MSKTVWRTRALAATGSSGGNPPRVPTAASLLTIAAGHAASAEALYHADPGNPDNGTYSASMWFLMGWAMEAALKAASLHFGADDASNRATGHDLPRALADARERGFVSSLVNLDNLANDLALTHSSYFFRYMPEGDTQVPGNGALALAVLKALIVEVGGLLGWNEPR